MLKNYRYNGKNALSLKTESTSAGTEKKRKEEIIAKTASNQLQIQQLQDRLYADGKEGLIILIQARDAAGKDGTIKHVMSGVNPQGVDVYSFKSPTHEDLAHDFLWRFNKALPVRGKIAIFNRSYYEDVLIVKVRELWKNYNLPDRLKNPQIIDRRYEQIREFEEYLYQNGYRIVKIFLNVSAKKQKERFLERIDRPEKNWKFSEADLAERGLWDQYTAAYEDAINATASKHNPWYVIPADQKWYARYLVSEAILHALTKIDPKYPQLSKDQIDKLSVYKAALLGEKGIDENRQFEPTQTEMNAAGLEEKKEKPQIKAADKD
ncbi:PPK2 family polyphosphate kinase [Allobaculum mucilyticum]|uniref:PPK2 family polyphosphate kinase n=1 Tax=Allobaculum mucilyticum TaxID=2834459 RepID=UPI001E475B44|nr:PPK2 family polyphosphate kinase [Allobaculum mucilyticum]UNT95802.1 hypothetical protein KWG62_10920 [Allobaculum mucilyticum]